MQDTVVKWNDAASYTKKGGPKAVKPWFGTVTSPTRVHDDKKTGESFKTKSGDEKVTTLKSYRRAKGLCFKCGEKWNPQHKCPTTVSLHVMEQLWQCVTEGADLDISNATEDSDSGDELMAISIQALNGIEGSRTVRLRGHMQGKEVFMLVDSGSSHSFISADMASVIQYGQPLAQSVHVTVANGAKLPCTHELPHQIWGCQGNSFHTTFKIIPLQGYDIILGMDWLTAHSPMKIH